MSHPAKAAFAAPIQLIPNLGGEEGDDDRSVRRSPEVRVAARLWALLYGAEAEILWPTASPDANLRRTERVAVFWPSALSESESSSADRIGQAAQPAYSWLASPGAVVPWLRTESLEAAYAGRAERDALAGASAACVRRVHDKAFAVEAGRKSDLFDRDLSGLLSVFGAEELSPPQAAIAKLEAVVRGWPAGAQRSLTLKPRLGTSGRGRVPVEGPDALSGVEGALPRLAARGGAVLEPWFDRVRDLSVCLHVAPGEPASGGAPAIRLLGSAEMLTTPGGGYSGHCGEIDARGRVFSGDPQDESLRADAAALGRLAVEAGYFGPCGVDAFRYRDFEEPTRERLRSAVEFNARPTMGLALLGLLRRLFPKFKAPLGLEPGERRAFLFAMMPADHEDAATRLADHVGLEFPPIRLTALEEEGSPQPTLFWGRDLAELRGAYQAFV